MAFSGTLVGMLRGRRHYFQVTWVDCTKAFEAVDGGYLITTTEGGKPYTVFITQEQMQLLIEHHPGRLKPAIMKSRSDRRLHNFMDEEFIGPQAKGRETLWRQKKPE